MPDTGFEQEIEVSTTNASGEITQLETVNAVVGRAYLYNSFYRAMSVNAAITNVIRSGQRTDFNYGSRSISNSTNISTNFPEAANAGIFALSEPIDDLNQDLYDLPYLMRNQYLYDTNKLVFRNVNNELTETLTTMIASPYNALWEPEEDGISFTTEFIKTTGTGTVSAIVIAKGESTINNPQFNSFSYIRDKAIPWSEWKNSTTRYAIEHTAAGSTMYVPATESTNLVRSFNFATKEYQRHISALLYAKIQGAMVSIKIGNKLFRVSNGTNTATTMTVNVSVWDVDSSAAVVTYPVSIPLNGLTALTTVAPVPVYNYDTGMLEVFMAISELTSGWTTKKIVVDPANPIAATISDVGTLQFCVYGGNPVSHVGTSAPDNHMIGFYDNGAYHLPMRTNIENGTKYPQLNTAGNATWFVGGVITTDFQSYKQTPFSSGYVSNFLKVRAEDGRIKNIDTSNGLFTMQYVYTSPLIAAVNLPTPIVKGEEDTLKIRFRFRLSMM